MAEHCLLRLIDSKPTKPGVSNMRGHVGTTRRQLSKRLGCATMLALQSNLDKTKLLMNIQSQQHPWHAQQHELQAKP
jgi:hypothetical protein